MTKSSSPYCPQKTEKRTKHWTLLFISDRGKTITLKHFRGLVISTVLIFLVSIVLSCFLSYYCMTRFSENKNLKEDLDNTKNLVGSLRKEIAIGLSRVENLKRRNAENRIGTRDNQKENSANQSGSTQAQPKTAVPDLPKESVITDGFMIFYEPDRNLLEVQYNIKNTTPKNRPVSGRTVVLLKNLYEKDQNRWLILPKVKLSSGNPTGKKGRYFSISYVKTIKHRTNIQKHPDQFHTAAVYVFSKNGRLLMEKEYPVGASLRVIHKKTSKPVLKAPADKTDPPPSSLDDTVPEEAIPSKENNDPVKTVEPSPIPVKNSETPSEDEDGSETPPEEDNGTNLIE